MSLQQIIRETSNDIWNQSGKYTHAELDATLKSFAHRIIKAAFEAARVEDMDTSECRHYEPKVYRLCDHCPSEAEKWNEANKARATKEKEVLALVE